uniref:HD/PDEase domain-containing protein n=1 Tax=Parascaris univalens TaxID=6257 RepID=A0A914ZWI2_PARUN
MNYVFRLRVCVMILVMVRFRMYSMDHSCWRQIRTPNGGMKEAQFLCLIVFASMTLYRKRFSNISTRMISFLSKSLSTHLLNVSDLKTEEGQWNYRGRPLEKSFLYDIVSNSIDSVDVDKFDYLLRDSHHAAIAIPFNQNSVMRLMDWMRPLDVIEQLPNGRALKYSRICFAVKVIDDVDSVGQSRYMLHEKLYSHHTVRAYEYMVLQALISADHYLHFEGDDRRRYQLSRTYENLGAFLKTDDSIIQMVENSSLDELKSASRILRDLSFRILPKLIGTVMMRNSNNCTQDKVKHRIYELADSNIVSEEDFIICIRSMHRGMGVEKHPMNEVFFYDHKAHAQQLEPYRIDQALLKHKSSLFGGSQSIMIYVSATTKAKSN